MKNIVLRPFTTQYPGSIMSSRMSVEDKAPITKIVFSHDTQLSFYIVVDVGTMRKTMCSDDDNDL